MTDSFEKLAMWIGNDLAICIANCPDDYSICSMVFKKGDNFVRHALDKKQVDEIIKALKEVRKEM